MNNSYAYQRNRIIKKYVSGIYHLNWIKLDGNSSFEHNLKVCELCLLLKEKKLDFLTRPIIENNGFIQISVNDPKEKREKVINNWIKEPIRIPDILYFQSNPFQPVIIEVTDSETRDHAESKSYPKEFSIKTVGVDEELMI